MTTLVREIAASADDAKQNTDDSVDLTANSHVIDAGTEHGGLRLLNITIPPGSTINSASLSLFINSGANDEPNHNLRGEAVDTGTFTTTSNDLDGRTRTTASDTWNDANLGAGNGTEVKWGAPAGDLLNGHDLAPIIQEIIDDAGWSSGDAIVLIFESNSGGTRDLGYYTFDNGSNIAELTIDYTAPAAGGGDRRRITIVN